MDEHIYLSSLSGKQFTRVGFESRGGKILKETYFAADRSNVKIEIDYTYTENGCK